MAVQEVGLLVADQLRVEVPPAVTLAGLALIVTTGLVGNGWQSLAVKLVGPSVASL